MSPPVKPVRSMEGANAVLGASQYCRPMKLGLRVLLASTTAVVMSGAMSAGAWVAASTPSVSSAGAAPWSEQPSRAFPARQPVSTRRPAGVSRDGPVIVPISAVGRLSAGFVSFATNSIAIPTSPRRPGDLLTLALYTYGEGSPSPSSVRGGGVATWHRAVGFLGYATDANLSIWWGVVTSTGPSLVTARFARQPGGGIGVAREFASSRRASWSMAGFGHSSSTNSRVTFPELIASPGRELYLGYAFSPGAPSARSTRALRFATLRSAKGNSIICAETDLKGRSPPQLTRPGTTQTP